MSVPTGETCLSELVRRSINVIDNELGLLVGVVGLGCIRCVAHAV
jgi:hypothetical protein